MYRTICFICNELILIFLLLVHIACYCTAAFSVGGYDFTPHRCTAFCMEKAFDGLTLEDCKAIKPCAKICLDLCQMSYKFGRNEPQCDDEFCDSLEEPYRQKFQDNCRDVCKFITQIYTVKSGSCSGKLDFEPLHFLRCDSECNDDYGCEGEAKCCLKYASSNSCMSCQMPSDHKYNYPPIISSDLKVTENTQSYAFDLNWESWDTRGYTGKILFVVRQMNVTGFYPPTDQLSKAQRRFVGVTDEKFFKVKTKPGWWSEFEVASVNKHGSKGFQKPSLLSRLSTDARPPSAPFNIVVSVTLIESTLIKVNNVTWFEPTETDLPVIHYSISFSCNFGSNQLQSPIIKPKDAVCIHGICQLVLRPDKTFDCSPVRFFVTVTAHCPNWRDRPLNSSKISHEIRVDRNSWLPYFGGDSEVSNDSATIALQVDYRKFSPDFVSVILKWVPPLGKEKSTYSLQRVRGYCTSPGSSWLIDLDQGYVMEMTEDKNGNKVNFNLHYDCEYAFQIQGMESSNFREKFTKRYFTPSCIEAAMSSQVQKHNCPKAQIYLEQQKPTPLGKLEDFNFIFIGKNISTMTVNAVIRWTFGPEHFRIVQNPSLRGILQVVIQILVYKVHKSIGIINRAYQPCVIYLDAIEDPRSGFPVLPIQLNLLDRKLAKSCKLQHTETYRVIGSIVYNIKSTTSGSYSEHPGPWSSFVMDTSIISFFDVFPPWKQELYWSLGIYTYLDALEYEKSVAVKKKQDDSSNKKKPIDDDDSNLGGGYERESYFDYLYRLSSRKVEVEITYIQVGFSQSQVSSFVPLMSVLAIISRLIYF